jgi:hypothetical protein
MILFSGGALPSRPYGIGSVWRIPGSRYPEGPEATQKNWVALTFGVAFVSAHPELIVTVIDANGRAKAQPGARGQCMNPVVASPIIL